MSEECPERRFRTLFISDVHLGARGSQADRLLDSLRTHDLDLPGTKVVVGDGPARAALQGKYPQAVFLDALHGERLAEAYAAAGVFVFPSKTDTFGLILLEALASGVPVAAFPVSGPRDVIGTAEVGVLSEDLREACLAALKLSPRACRRFAAGHGWEASARAFINNISNVRNETGSGLQIAAERPQLAT